MTIKLRIIFGFLATTVIMAACILSYVTYTMRDNAEQEYAVGSEQQLNLMAGNLTDFIRTAERNVALLAKDPRLTSAKACSPAT